MNYFTTEPGTYPGTIDDILDRHDSHINYTPKSYPDWPDKKWAGVFHSHNKALRIIEDQKEWQKIKEKYIARENFIKSLQALSQSKQLRIDAREKYARQCSMVVLIKSKNNKGILERSKELKEALSYEADDLLVWFWNLMVICNKTTTSKKHRTDTRGVIQEIEPLIVSRNLPLSWDELKKYISNIKPERMKEIQNLMGYCS